MKNNLENEDARNAEYPYPEKKTRASLDFKWTILLLVLLCFLGCSTFRQARIGAGEAMMWSTYALASRNAIGSCFVIGQQDPLHPSRARPVVVTSLHMVKTAGKQPIYMLLKLPDAHGRLSYSVLQLDFQGKDKASYVRHPKYDIVAFLFPPVLEEGEILPMFLKEKMLDKRPDGAMPGEDISFVGFPNGASGTEAMFPVLRGGKVASYDPTILEMNGFMINADVFPGDSGAPVFSSTGNGKIRLVGMVISRVGLKDQRVFPLGFAINAKVVQETLDLLKNRSSARPSHRDMPSAIYSPVGYVSGTGSLSQ